jgi:hypothetical protein
MGACAGRWPRDIYMSNKMLRATADVVYDSRGSVDPELLTSYFEERGKTNGISMFLNKRLSEYLKPSDWLSMLTDSLHLKG